MRGVHIKNYSGLRNRLSKEGKLLSVPLGDKMLVSVAEPDVYRIVADMLHKDIFSFVHPYDEKALTHEYTHGKNGERVTHC